MLPPAGAKQGPKQHTCTHSLLRGAPTLFRCTARRHHAQLRPRWRTRRCAPTVVPLTLCSACVSLRSPDFLTPGDGFRGVQARHRSRRVWPAGSCRRSDMLHQWQAGICGGRTTATRGASWRRGKRLHIVSRGRRGPHPSTVKWPRPCDAVPERRHHPVGDAQGRPPLRTDHRPLRHHPPQKHLCKQVCVCA